MDPEDKQIKPRRWKYKPSGKVRKHISHWEGPDFEKQNQQFGGDAIGAKGIEFSRMMGDRGKYFTQDELDGMFSTFYNLSPDTFQKVIMPQIDRYVEDTSPDNLKAIQDTMRNRWTLAKRVHQNGIRNRANADVNLMGNVQGFQLPDSNTVIFPLQKWEDTKQPEFQPQFIAEPKLQNIEPAPAPVITNAPVAVNNKQDVWDTFDRGATAYGSRPLLPPLRKLMPSLNEMMADSQEQYVRDILGMENPFKGVLIHAKNGKLPRYEDGVTPDTSWHEWWLSQRGPQFNENLNSASDQQRQMFQQYGSGTVEGQLNNLRSSKVYQDPNLFNESVPDYEKLNSFQRKSLIGGGEVRKGIDGNNSIYIDSYAGDDVRTHEYTHGLSRIPDLNNPDVQVRIMTPQDAKIAQIIKEAEANNTLYYDPEFTYEGDEYAQTPNEKTSELYMFRKKKKLNPKKKVELDDIKKWREENSLPYNIGDYSDDVLLRMFNDVAYVDNNNKNTLPMAKNGKRPVLKPRRR